MGQNKLAAQMVPANGVYMVNCPYVEYGYFGNLEIFSQKAFDTLIAKLDTCYTSSEINWKVGVHGGKHGPMGEDLFAQTCLDLHGVRRADAFDVTTDGACPDEKTRSSSQDFFHFTGCSGKRKSARAWEWHFSASVFHFNFSYVQSGITEKVEG